MTEYLSNTVNVLLLARFAMRHIETTWAMPVVLPAVGLALFVLNRHGERTCPWWSILLLPTAGLALMPLHLPLSVEEWVVLMTGGVWLAAHGAARLYPQQMIGLLQPPSNDVNTLPGPTERP